MSAKAPARRLLIGEWTFEPSLNRLSRDGEQVELEPLASRLLEVLASRPGHVFSIDDLIEAVWDRRVVSDNPIYKLMANLRRALGDTPNEPDYIETIRKRGYRLVAPVRETEPAVSAAPAGLPPDEIDAGLKRRTRLIAAAAIAAVAAVAFWWLGPGPDDEVEAAAATPAIAVLPFTDLSEDGQQSYLGSGIAEELIHVLAQRTEFGVIGRTSSFAIAEKTEDLREIGDLLGARYIVEGSVRKSGEQIRVTAQLIDAETGLHAWSGNFDRRYGEILAMQSRIAAEILEAIYLSLGVDSPDTPPIGDATAVVDAYDAYLRGRHQLSIRGAIGASKAERLFLDALAADDSLVQAMTGLVESQYVLTFHGAKKASDAYALAEIWARRALALAPGNASVHVAMGRLAQLGARLDEAEQAFRTALDLDPEHPTALAALAWHLHLARRPEEARVVFDKVLAMEPAASLLLVSAGMNSEELGDYSCAGKLYERAVEISPQLMNAQFALGSYKWRFPRDLDAAERYLERAYEFDPSGSIPAAFLALTALERDDVESARQWVDAANAIAYEAYWPTFSRLALAIYTQDEEAAGAAANLLASYSAEPLALRYLRDSALAAGSTEQAIAVYPDWLRSDSVDVTAQNARLVADLAFAYHEAGEREKAMSLASAVLQAVERTPRKAMQGTWLSDVVAASILGGAADGMQKLQDAHSEGWHMLAWWELEENRALDDLRGLPGYREMAEALRQQDRAPLIDEIRPGRTLEFCERLP